MIKLNHQPLVFWFAALLFVVLSVVLLYSPPAELPPEGEPQLTASAYSDQILDMTRYYPSGSGQEKTRAWVAGVREAAINGALSAESEANPAGMRLWSDLLNSISSASEEGLSSREVAERSSLVAFNIHRVSAHYIGQR